MLRCISDCLLKYLDSNKNLKTFNLGNVDFVSCLRTFLPNILLENQHNYLFCYKSLAVYCIVHII